MSTAPLLASEAAAPVARYRFGFILSTSLGNSTRYLNFRKFAVLDPEVEFVWAPVKHYFAPDETNPFRRLPGALQRRAIVLYQSWPVLRCFDRFDAVMIHMYEVDILTALRGYFMRRPVRVVSSDDAPIIDPANYPIYPADADKPAWKRALRLRIDLWRARRADLSIPYSEWARALILAAARVNPDKVRTLHVGLDLSLWNDTPRPLRAPRQKVNLLFVGGDFVRKGGADLLEAFRRSLHTFAELHLVTREAPSDLPGDVHVYLDLGSNDPRLVHLFAQADIFVLPTTSDLSSWVVLEAMASRCPVITTRMAGITELIEEGSSGLFVPQGDIAALEEAVTRLAGAPALCRAMGERARAIVEERFSAEINVPKILSLMKEEVDVRRRGSARSR